MTYVRAHDMLLRYPWPALIDEWATLAIFTIYWSPADFPGQYVVRRTLIGSPLRDVEPVTVDVVPRLALSLQDARAWVPYGLIRSPRAPDDDAVIVESWY